MYTHHKIIIGDSRRMTELGDQSVHLVVTSPPYWQLKDYGSSRQIGFHDSYENYIDNLNLVWQECFRVLHEGCRLCINIGDQFARSVYYGRYKVIPIRTEIIKFCEMIGLDYMGAIIWQKITTTNTTGGATIMGSFPYPRNGILKIDYEFILILRKQGTPPKVSKAIKEKSKISTMDWNTYFTGHWKFAGEKQRKHLAAFPVELPHRLIRMFSFVGDTVLDPFLGSGTTSLAAKNLNRNSVGYEINADFIPVIKAKLKIPRKNTSKENTFEFIRSAHRKQNFKSELTALPYHYNDLNSIDSKIFPANAGIYPIRNTQAKTHKNVIPAKAGIHPNSSAYSKTHPNVIPAKAGIYTLPEHVSRHLNTYGSKISLNDPGNQTEYYTVKEILSPEKIKLNNGQIVRLIGIFENSVYRQQSIRFLHEKTRGQKVFLKFDHTRFDETGNLLAYVYLKNKTFLNAHLIKSGYVSVDIRQSFKYQTKFLRLCKEGNKNI